MKPNLHIAVVGATGAVGREVIAILAERNFPVASLKALASARSAGKEIPFGNKQVVVQEITPEAFRGIDLAFFGVPNNLAREYCAIAAKLGAICVDKSSAHRLDPDVPLVVPEVNPEDISLYKKRNIVASPNCVAAPLVQVLAPLHALAPIKRVVMSSYQAVSGAGQSGVTELDQQVRDLFNMREMSVNAFQKRIAFNVIPCIPAKNGFLEDGSTTEETKVIDETRKILHLPNLLMAVTCVRVPTFSGHSESVNIEFDSAISKEEARDALGKARGIVVLDDLASDLFPTPLEATGEDTTLVGRIREDKSVKYGLSLWLSSDNLRTGAALNAVRIAEMLVREYL